MNYNEKLAQTALSLHRKGYMLDQMHTLLQKRYRIGMQRLQQIICDYYVGRIIYTGTDLSDVVGS